MNETSLTIVRHGRYAIIAGIRAHQAERRRAALHSGVDRCTRALEWLQVVRPELAFATGHLCKIPGREGTIRVRAWADGRVAHRPPWGDPYAVKCLHVAAMRATAVSLVFLRRPFWTPRTYAAPISPVLRRRHEDCTFGVESGKHCGSRTETDLRRSSPRRAPT